MWKFKPLFGIFLICCTVTCNEQKTYDGYKLYDVKLDSPRKVEISSRMLSKPGLDFFKDLTNNVTQILVSPAKQTSFELQLDENEIEFLIAEDNLGDAIIRELASRRSLNEQNTDNYEFNFFPSYEGITKFIDKLVKNSTTRYAKRIKIGESFQGRSIYALRLRKSEDRPVFLIEAGSHAREWASHVTAMYIMKKLVEDAEYYADKYTFIVIPCLNPDGYEYSRNKDRLWRKTRSETNITDCKGVDLMRNFDTHWGEVRAEHDPCSVVYAGTGPFSEPESAAIRNIIYRYKPANYLSLHSYGSLIMYPWGYSQHLPSNWRAMHAIGRKMAKNMRKLRGTKYIVGSHARLLHQASGSSTDWAMENGVKLVYTIELPESKHRSFILPRSEIKPVVEETYEGFKTLVDLSLSQL